MRLPLAKFEATFVLNNELIQAFFEAMYCSVVFVKCFYYNNKRVEKCLTAGGVIVHECGLVLTNIPEKDGAILSITYHNYKTLDATAFYREGDLVLLKPLQPLEEEDEVKYANVTHDKLAICEEVIAIGDDFKPNNIKFCFAQTYVTCMDDSNYYFINLGYTDGCPLFNCKGDVVGLLDGELDDDDAYKMALLGADLKEFCDRGFASQAFLE